MLTLLFLAISLAGDVYTTKLATSAGAIETNPLYGRKPNIGLLSLTHVAIFLIGSALVHSGADPIVWGATAAMAGISVWNLNVWRKQRKLNG